MSVFMWIGTIQGWFYFFESLGATLKPTIPQALSMEAVSTTVEPGWIKWEVLPRLETRGFLQRHEMGQTLKLLDSSNRLSGGSIPSTSNVKE